LEILELLPEMARCLIALQERKETHAVAGERIVRFKADMADFENAIAASFQKRSSAAAYFSQEEGPQLVATARTLFPRWSAFILTGLVAGLRWGESAALYRTDIDWRRGRIHVQRTWSTKAGRIEAPKDSEGRHVKASPALLAGLRAHVEAMKLEGEVKGWSLLLRDKARAAIRSGNGMRCNYLEVKWWRVRDS
jgi:integrase